DRPARGAARLAVVAETNCLRPQADPVGVAMVRGLGVLGPYPVEHVQGFFFRLDGAAPADEAGPLDDDFGGPELPQRPVAGKGRMAVRKWRHGVQLPGCIMRRRCR